jgi:hypothetical protein
MLIKLIQLLEKLTGAVLGGVGLGIQLGNVLVCLFTILLGPAFVIGLFSR